MFFLFACELTQKFLFTEHKFVQLQVTQNYFTHSPENLLTSPEKHLGCVDFRFGVQIIFACSLASALCLCN